MHTVVRAALRHNAQLCFNCSVQLRSIAEVLVLGVQLPISQGKLAGALLPLGRSAVRLVTLALSLNQTPTPVLEPNHMEL